MEFLTSQLFLTSILPLIFFTLGVFISDILNLHKVGRRALYAMALPVGVFMTGFMVNTGKVVTPGIENGIPSISKQFGFMQDIPQYMMFAGILMFIGVSVPTIFEELRRKYGKVNPDNPAGGANTPPAGAAENPAE